MGSLVIFLNLLLSCQYHAEANLEDNTISLVRDYFIRIGARVIRVFTCSDYDKLRLVKSLQSVAVWLVIGHSREGTAFPPYDPYAWERSPLKADYYKFGVFLDHDCSANQQIFIESAASRYANTNHFWFIWSKEKNFSEAQSADLTIDSEVTWAHPDEHDVVQLHDLYKINFTWPLIATHIGTWDRYTGLAYNLTDFKYSRRGNLQQLMFDTAVAVYHEEIEVDDIHQHLVNHTETNYTTLMTRSSYASLLMLKDKFNFTCSLHQTTTTRVNPFPNGSFDGQIGMMQRQEATLSPSPLLFFPSRNKACDFVAPTWKFQTAVMFRHPKVTRGQNALLAPFTITVWMSAMGSWLLVLLTIKMAFWFEYKYSKLDRDGSLETSWSASALATLAAISEQGTDLNARSLTWRIIFLFTLIQVVLLNNYYGGGVVSTLLRPPPKTIRTAKDLLDSKLIVGYENVSHNIGFFERTVDPVVIEIYNKKVFPPTQSSPNGYRVDIGVAKIKEDNFAFQVEQIQAYPYMEKTFTDAQKCALTEITLFPMGKGPVYALVPKGSAYKELLQYGYRMLWERGLMQYKWLEWRPRKPTCLGSGDVVSVEMSAVYFAFLILAYGSLVAVIIFSCELTKFYRGASKSSRKREKIFERKPTFYQQQRHAFRNEKLFFK